MFTPNCEGDTHYIKNYQTIHFKYVQFTVCHLYLKRTTFKKLNNLRSFTKGVQHNIADTREGISLTDPKRQATKQQVF